ncbi:serine hydrolase [Saccharopolyspora sp. NPDC047091]|uniref:serine hydrolase n=1 Tax=Saccharopolyspora sp. NPDC047091 TaxID=3155924 RepID=UPI0033D3D16A
MDHSDRRFRRALALLGCSVLLAVTTAGCGGQGDRTAHEESGQWWVSRAGYPDAPARARPSPNPAVRSAVRQVDEYADRLSGSTVAVAVLDRESGAAVGGEHADEEFTTASVSKLLVAMDVAERRREGLRVSSSDAELIRRALAVSDDGAMNALWDRFDGAGAISRVAVRYGLTRTLPPEVPGRWGDTRTSARDVAAVLAKVPELPAAERDLVLSPLEEAPRTAAEGFDQQYGLKAGTRRAAVKPGWMCCSDGRRSVHSAGLIGPDRRYAVAVLSTQPSSKSYSQASEVVTEAAAPLLRRLG